MSGQLIPTLVPDWTRSPTASKDGQPTPVSYTTSTSSSSQLKPTYNAMVELHTEAIARAIAPFVTNIVTESHRNINGYTLGSSIGYGQFGKVYKARSQNQVFAIKSIAKRPWNNQQYSMNQTMRQIKMWKSRGMAQNMTGDEAVMLMNVQKCRWEIYILSQLRSPYVVQLHECLDSLTSRAIWIVNEWCSLGELEWKRESREQVPRQWSQLLPSCDLQSFAQKALKDLTRGLQYLQSQGCVHRDIKPSNILVDGRQKLLKLSDFGCSILLPDKLPFQDQLLHECYQTELNKIVGTPAFIAPELCQFGNPDGEDVKDGFKLDMWSVGVTLYGLLFNELPFYGESEFDTYDKVIHKSLEHRLNGDPLNDMVVGRMLEKDPQVRIGIQKLSELVIEDESPAKPTKTKQAQDGKQTEKHSGVQKFFAKFRKLKKKDKKPKSQLVDSRTAASVERPSISSDTNTPPPEEQIPRSEPLSKPSPSPRASPLPEDDEYSGSSFHSSMSSFEEPVQVSDMFKHESIPHHYSTDENMPQSSSGGINESSMSASESEPRRIDHCGLPQTGESHSYDVQQSFEFSSHSHQRTPPTKASLDGSDAMSQTSYELRTPPKLPQYQRFESSHPRQPSSLTRETDGDMSLSYSQPSFQISVPELPEDDFYDISSSKEPSFRVNVPSELSEHISVPPKSQHPTQAQHSSARHRAQNSSSTSSSSPIKIPTPMKALIHVGNSPVRDTNQVDVQDVSPLKDHNGRIGGLAHSRDISNFQSYIVQPDDAAQVPQNRDNRKSVLTEDVIEKYLNYAENV
ncbi:ELM1 (YKL048C) [Zygosaccharomyces parabailii]|nr:ELM1 (YKL048C) [Zygosaccharomyces parabailii]